MVQLAHEYPPPRYSHRVCEAAAAITLGHIVSIIFDNCVTVRPKGIRVIGNGSPFFNLCHSRKGKCRTWQCAFPMFRVVASRLREIYREWERRQLADDEPAATSATSFLKRIATPVVESAGMQPALQFRDCRDIITVAFALHRVKMRNDEGLVCVGRLSQVQESTDSLPRFHKDSLTDSGP